MLRTAKGWKVFATPIIQRFSGGVAFPAYKSGPHLVVSCRQGDSPYWTMTRHLITGWLIISLIGYGTLLSAGNAGTPTVDQGYSDSQQNDGLPDLEGSSCADHCGHSGQHLSGLPVSQLPGSWARGITSGYDQAPPFPSVLSPPRFRPPITL